MRPSPRTLPPPEIPGYRDPELIGKGGYSTVYKYQQERMQRPVAVKVLADFGANKEALRKFQDEASTMAKFGDHRYIVQIYDAGVAGDGQPYLIMSYCPGKNLDAEVTAGRLSVSEVVTIGEGIAEAVQDAHKVGIIHRDIKPSNILTDQQGARRLTDFGIAAHAAASTDEEVPLSVPWSPPEILLGTSTGSVASDIYSLGATLWHLLMGHSPYAVPGGDNSAAAIEHRITTMPAPPISRNDVPPKLASLIGTMMAADPRKRPTSAEAVAKELASIGRHLHPIDTMTRTVSRSTGPRASLPAELMKTTVRTPSADNSHGSGALMDPWPWADSELTEMRADLVDKTPPVEPVEPAEVPRRRGRTLIVAGITAAVVVVAIVIGVIGSGGGTGKGPSASSSGNSTTGADQNAGVLGEDTPPGVPKITASRSNAKLLHFTWTYDNALANDTFRWQTPDGKHHGTVQTPSLDIADQAGVKLCIQVKVVRADGSNGAVAWSPEGCGT